MEVQGRGELHLGVLIENMRREGFELSVSPPRVVYGVDEFGKKTEPFEEIILELGEADVGAVIEALSQRKGELSDMESNMDEDGRSRLTFVAPSRGLIGFRQEFISALEALGSCNVPFTRTANRAGTLIKFARGCSLAPFLERRRRTPRRTRAARDIVRRTGVRGVCDGDDVGEHTRENDLEVNPTKEKN